MKHFIHTINHSARAAATLLLGLLTASTAWADITISTADDWNAFATAVNGGTTYKGQTVTLGADITVSTMVGTSDHKFSGTFYGGGHTLTFNYTYNNSSTNLDGCAPFRYIDGATLRCLKVAGTITSNRCDYIAGIAAYSYGNCTIQNCISSITINDSYNYCYHGGFVGKNVNGLLTITNSLFNGKMVSNSTNNCGGFVGADWNTISIVNCLFAPVELSGSSSGCATFVPDGGNGVTNSYYTQPLGSAQGTAVGTMTNKDLATALGSGWEVRDESVVPVMDANNLSIAIVSRLSDCYNYTGSAIAIDYTVTTFDGTSLTKGTHYTETISPATVQEEGDYTLTITGTGYYSGSQTLHFTVADAWTYYMEGLEKAKPKTDVTVINSGNKPTSLSGWYVVTGDVSYNGRISLTGETHLILADGATMTVSVNDVAIQGDNLYIYGQENGSGKLDVTATSGHHAISIGSLYMYGGIVNANGTYNGFNSQSSKGTLDFHGGVGHFTGGSGNYFGINTGNGIVSISWTNDNDEFYTNSIFRDATVPLEKPFWISGTETEVTTYTAGQTIVPVGSRKVNIAPTEHGTVTTNKGHSAAGNTVTLTVVPETDYGIGTVSVMDADNGVVAVTNAGDGKYTFTMPAKSVTVSATFVEQSNNLVHAVITGISDDYIYTGSAINIGTPVVTLVDNQLTAGTDYDVTYTFNGANVSEFSAVGEYTLTITPHSGSTYMNSKSQTFRILDFTNATLSGVKQVYQWTDVNRTIEQVVTLTGQSLNATLVAGTDYDVTYQHNGVATNAVKEPGSYTMTVTGKETYAACGSLTADFIVSKFEKYDTGTSSLVTTTTPDDNGHIFTAATTSMNDGWYVVTDDVTVSSRITVDGNVHLVLCDGVTLTASRGIEVHSGKSLTIYTQSGNTGVLTTHAYGSYGSAIGSGFGNAGSITIHGGEINAICHGDVSKSIGGPNSTVTIYGGRISTSYEGNGVGIGGSGATVNLGWCRSSDYIYAKSYDGTVNLLSNFVLDNNRQQVATTSNISGNRIVPQGADWFVVFNSQGGSAVAQQSVANNATATEPTAPTRTGYTFSGWYTGSDCTDGNEYNFSTAVTQNLTLFAKWTLTAFTINLPANFEATVGETSTTTATMNQTVTLSITTGTLTGSVTVTDANSQTVAVTDNGDNTYTFTMPPSNVSVTAFAGIIEPDWTLVGTYKTQNFTASDTYYYGFVGTAGTGTELGTFVQVGGYVRVKPMRAYLVAPGGTPKAAARRMTRAADGEELPATLRVRLLGSNGETTGILSVDGSGFTVQGSNAWYTLDGRKLAGEPTQRGIYINKGKKVIIK